MWEVDVSQVTTPGTVFEPVPLPSLPPGELTVGRLDPVLWDWATSAPLRALAEASGWEWPPSTSTAELLARLAELSGDWDFRGGKERHLVASATTAETTPAITINDRLVDEGLIAAAARALDLVQAGPIPADSFTHLAVLSGQVAACVNRTRYAADLLRNGLSTDSVVVLGGHRELAGSEPERASELGMGSLFDEADAAVAATRRAFDLGDPEQSQESTPHLPGWDESLRGASARYSWKGAEVIIVPSSEPDQRRVNTSDQLRYWAELAGIDRDDRVLLITTQIYVPFQQLAALRLLGVERGCSVYCCGVDASSAALPIKQFSGREYLQEIRSALLAASGLMAAAQQAGG
jgi:hypothetical protein